MLVSVIKLLLLWKEKQDILKVLSDRNTMLEIVKQRSDNEKQHWKHCQDKKKIVLRI